MEQLRKLTTVPVVLLCILCFVAPFLRAGRVSADTFSEFEAKHKDYLSLIFYDTTDFTVNYVYKPPYERNGRRADAQYDNAYAELDLGVPFSADSGAAFNILYDRQSFKFSPELVSRHAPIRSDVQSLSLQSAIGTFFTDDFAGAIVFQPSINSDFERFDNKDFQYLYGPVLSYRMQPNLAFQAAVFHSISTYHQYFYPLVGVCYKPDDRWRVNIAFPSYTRVGYFLTQDTELFSMLEYSYDEYHARLGRRKIDSNIRVDTAQLGAGVATKIASNLLLTVESGVTFGTRYRLIPFRGREFDGNLDSGFFLSMSFGVQF